MTPKQSEWLDNMTTAQARALLEKYDHNPEAAADKSEDTLTAFRVAWEVVYPGQYIQRMDMADGVYFNVISAI
jgi:hypothetical protein